jgi:hypothetical protein
MSDITNIIGLITVNNKEVLEVSGVPSASPGIPAPIGSIAMYDNGSGVGEEYIKIGAADTAWDRVATLSQSNVLEGAFLRLPIYNTDATGYTIDDTVPQNGNNIDVAIVPQPTRSAAIEYRIPNPGDAITAADFVLTEGAQTINGLKTFNDGITVNGTLTFINTTNLEVTDKLIRINKGGAAASGGGSGFEIEEDGLITGSFKSSSNRQGWDLLAPANAYALTLNQNNLTAARTQYFADTNGTFVMRPNATPGVLGQIAYWQDANNLISASGFTYSGGVLTVPNVTVSSLGAGVVHSSAAGVLSSSAVVLTSEVSGILPIANGGTNSGTALNNGRLMYSSAGGIVEYSAMQPNQVYFGAATTGLPAQSVNLWWDITNSRLGIGNNAPARQLHVTGSSLFNAPVRYADAGALKANWEVFQSQVQTTTNAVTPAATIALPADSEVLIEARIMGRNSANGNSAAYVRTARFKNVGGTCTINTLQADYTSEDVKAWDGTLAVSGTNAVVNVAGAASTTVDWAVTYFVQVLS